MRTSVKKVAGVGVLALSMVTIGSVASAAGPEPLINGCVGKLTGLLRVIDPARSQTCSKLETPISWSQRGVPGPVGPTGATGPAGPVGPQGPAGGDALWARVQTRDAEDHAYAATLVSKSRVVGMTLNQADFTYRIQFDRPVDQCAAQATAVNSHNEFASVSYLGLPADVIEVTLWIEGWPSAVAGDFVLTVHC
jgi:hypothetical protein